MEGLYGNNQHKEKQWCGDGGGGTDRAILLTDSVSIAQVSCVVPVRVESTITFYSQSCIPNFQLPCADCKHKL